MGDLIKRNDIKHGAISDKFFKQSLASPMPSKSVHMYRAREANDRINASISIGKMAVTCFQGPNEKSGREEKSWQKPFNDQRCLWQIIIGKTETIFRIKLFEM